MHLSTFLELSRIHTIPYCAVKIWNNVLIMFHLSNTSNTLSDGKIVLNVKIAQ